MIHGFLFLNLISSTLFCIGNYCSCFIFQGGFGKLLSVLFVRIGITNLIAFVSSWRYEQEDEWNEFLERTDTSKVHGLLEGMNEDDGWRDFVFVE